MANEWSVTPAGDFSSGLQGLGLALKYAGEAKAEREETERKRVAEQEAQVALYDALQSNDPQKMMEAATKYPSIQQQMAGLLGLQQDFQKQEATDFATEVLTNPERAGEIAERRAALLELQGRDPQHTRAFLQMWSQDPKGALNNLELRLASVNPQVYEAFQKTRPAPAEAVKGIEVGGSVINPITGEVIYQGAPEVQEQFEVLSPEQAVAMGLPTTGAFKRNKNTGEVSAIGGAQTVINNNPAQATESERTAGILANRLDFAQSQINEVLGNSPEAEMPGAIPSALDSAGLEYLARLSNSEDRQIIEEAQRDMLDAALTLGTGAAYTREQIEGYRKSYFPQLGDEPKTVEAKSSRLKNLINAAYTKAGRGAPAVMRSNPSDVVTVASQAEFDALPSGAMFIEDGVQYRKP